MSKVEELLEKYNPDGVPDKLLVECSLIDYGYPFTSSMFTDDSSYIPIIRIRDVKPGKASTYYMGNYSKEYIVKRGDILVGMDGEFNLEKWNDIDSLLNQRVARITEMPSKSTKGYLYHILGPIFKKIEREISGGSVKHLSVKIINSISIPLPHIKVQEEIVKILDSFTNLIDALNEELSLRQKQFEYYREKLLTFDDKSVYTTLGKVGEFTRGNGLQKKDFTESGFPCIHYGQIHTSYNTSAYSTISYCSKSLAKKLKKAKYGDLLIATTSEDVDACCKAIAWLGEGEVAYSGDSYCFSHNENPKYMAYLFQSNMFYNQKKTSATGAKVIRVSGDSMSQFILPIPSLAIQQSIVEKLDAFESLISSLKEEIALRQKQYEYYREKLLTFD